MKPNITEREGFEFTYRHGEKTVTYVFTQTDLTWKDLRDEFDYFLKGCGFYIDERED